MDHFVLYTYNVDCTELTSYDSVFIILYIDCISR